MSNDIHRGRGGRYMIDENGDRVPVPVKPPETPAAPVKKQAPTQPKPKRSKS